MLFLWEHLNIVVFGNKQGFEMNRELFLVLIGISLYLEGALNTCIMCCYSAFTTWFEKKKDEAQEEGNSKGMFSRVLRWTDECLSIPNLSYSVYWSRRVMRRLNFFCYHSPWGFICKCGIRSDLRCQRWLRYIQGCVLCSRGLYLPTLCEQSLGLFFCEDIGYLMKKCWTVYAL